MQTRADSCNMNTVQGKMCTIVFGHYISWDSVDSKVIYIICITGKIVEEDKHINVENEQLYVIQYADVDCYHPDVVVERARQRLGETRYAG